MLKKYFVFLFILSIGAITVAAQSLSPTVLSSAGNYHNSGGVSLSWTTGELMIQTFQADSVKLTQGFHQSDISVTTAIDEMSEFAMNAEVYPNPVRQRLTIDFENMVDQTIHLKLVSVTGNTILQREIANPSTQLRINLSGINSGTYMLEVKAKNKRKVFKIVKH